MRIVPGHGPHSVTPPSPEPPLGRDVPRPRETPADVAARRAATPVDAALRELVGALDEAILVVHPDLALGFANDAFARLAGRPLAELVGRRLGALLPAAMPPLDAPAVRQTLADGRPRRVRLSLAEAGGTRELDVDVSRTEGGLLLLRLAEPPAGAAAEAELARALAEGEAARAESALHRELAACVARSTDESALRALCTVARRAVPSARAAIQESREGALREVAAAADAGVPAEAPPTLAERAAAERRVCREGDAAHGPAIAVPLVAHEQVLGVLLLVRPPGADPFSAAEAQRLRLVAEHAALALWKVRLLEQTAAASEAKGSFLATMSHELRTPLTALTGYGELLDDGILGPLSAPQHEMVSRMCGVIDGLTTMVDEMLTFTTLEAGREKVRLATVATADLLQAAAAVAEPAARQKGLAFGVEVGADAPRLLTDPDKARKILAHLAGNAVKFTERGRVTLSVAECEGEARFAVADTGIGLPEGAEATIFEPFVQLDAGLSRRYGGTGLGLYIASRLARLLGGRVEVRSALGEGSEFALVLPGVVKD